VLLELDALVIAPASRPAAGERDASRSWYDVVARPDGRIVLAVGDVAGRATDAVPVRSVAQTLMRRIVEAGARPDEVVPRLRAVLRWLDGARATVVCVELTPPGELEIARTGHPPPLLVRRDGGVDFVPGPVGPPLGAQARGRSVASCRVHLDPGDTLVVYTASLVEGPDIEVDDGLARLAAAARACAAAPLDELCDQLVRLSGSFDDRSDVAAAVAVRRAVSSP
jgi:serine phosphatase RsbU (regulator of sigma subunit)